MSIRGRQSPETQVLSLRLQVKQALWAGGIERANKPAEQRVTPGLRSWEDIEIIYAGELQQHTVSCSVHWATPGMPH